MTAPFANHSSVTSYTPPMRSTCDKSIMMGHDRGMASKATKYTDEERSADVDAARRASEIIHELQRRVSVAAELRSRAVHRLRNLGDAQYPELADILGVTYGTVQRQLEKAANATDTPSPKTQKPFTSSSAKDARQTIEVLTSELLEITSTVQATAIDSRAHDIDTDALIAANEALRGALKMLAPQVTRALSSLERSI